MMMNKKTWVMSMAIAMTMVSAAGCADDGSEPASQGSEGSGGSGATGAGTTGTPTAGSESATSNTSGTSGSSGTPGSSGGSQSGSESGSSGGSPSGSSGGSATCWSLEFDCGEAGPEPLVCGSTAVCPTVEATRELDGSATTLVDPDGLDCVVEGLRAGTVGSYEIDIEAEINDATYHRLELFADGTVLSTVEVLEDKCSGVGQRWERLRGAPYLDDCLARAADDGAAIACVLGVGDPDQCVANEGQCS